MMVNRNIILLQYQTETHRKMIVQIIQEQSQEHPEIILRKNCQKKSQHRRDSPEDSQESDTELSPPPLIDAHRKFNRSRGDERKDKSQRHGKDGFVPDKAPKHERDAAHGRLKKAFENVTMAMQYSQKNRATETRYVGNLALNTTAKDRNKVIRCNMGHMVVVEEIAIPCI